MLDRLIGLMWGGYLLSLFAVMVTVIYAIWGGNPRWAATAIVLAVAFGFLGNLLYD